MAISKNCNEGAVVGSWISVYCKFNFFECQAYLQNGKALTVENITETHTKVYHYKSTHPTWDQMEVCKRVGSKKVCTLYCADLMAIDKDLFFASLISANDKELNFVIASEFVPNPSLESIEDKVFTDYAPSVIGNLSRFRRRFLDPLCGDALQVPFERFCNPLQCGTKYCGDGTRSIPGINNPSHILDGNSRWDDQNQQLTSYDCGGGISQYSYTSSSVKALSDRAKSYIKTWNGWLLGNPSYGKRSFPRCQENYDCDSWRNSKSPQKTISAEVCMDAEEFELQAKLADYDINTSLFTKNPFLKYRGQKPPSFKPIIFENGDLHLKAEEIVEGGCLTHYYDLIEDCCCE